MIRPVMFGAVHINQVKDPGAQVKSSTGQCYRTTSTLRGSKIPVDGMYELDAVPITDGGDDDGEPTTLTFCFEPPGLTDDSYDPVGHTAVLAQKRDT